MAHKISGRYFQMFGVSGCVVYCGRNLLLESVVIVEKFRGQVAAELREMASDVERGRAVNDVRVFQVVDVVDGEEVRRDVKLVLVLEGGELDRVVSDEEE